MKSKTQKTVLITGASSGIGLSSVPYFQERGWNVVATMRSPELAPTLSSLSNVCVAKLDVNDPQVIFQAATDDSWRLRYISGKQAKLFIFLRWLLPDGAFQGLMRRSLAS